jgi:hypothetical protein
MIVATSILLLVAPVLILIGYVSLPPASKWRRSSLALLLWFLFLLHLWAGFLLWTKINTQLVLVKIVEHGLPASDINLSAPEGIVLHMLDRPWLFIGYVSTIILVAYWSWRRNRRISSYNLHNIS